MESEKNVNNLADRLQKIVELFKLANILRRDLQNYSKEEITGLMIVDKHSGKERIMTGAEAHNKITFLTSNLKDWHKYSEVEQQQFEELKIILEKIKKWLAVKNKETRQ